MTVRRLAAVMLLLLGGCGTSAGTAARARADVLAATSGFERVEIQTERFLLLSYIKSHAPIVRVYIEGDGHAWRDRTTPSDDPTPWRPLALELAAADPAKAVAYLARPCQFLKSNGTQRCDVAWWTNFRYHDAVIDSISRALDRLLAATGANRLELVGFSGGGAIATLIAARRQDVINLRTVGANLDTQLWTTQSGVSPLQGSLNPVDFARKLAKMPQLHIIGTDDEVVGRAVLESYRARSGRAACVTIVALAGMRHVDNWRDSWPALLRRPIRCEKTVTIILRRL